MISKVNIHVFNECSGEHTHAYPQILVPLQETMMIRVGSSEYEVTPQEQPGIVSAKEIAQRFGDGLLQRAWNWNDIARFGGSRGDSPAR